jgi:hypothetical protein
MLGLRQRCSPERDLTEKTSMIGASATPGLSSFLVYHQYMVVVIGTIFQLLEAW